MGNVIDIFRGRQPAGEENEECIVLPEYTQAKQYYDYVNACVSLQWVNKEPGEGEPDRGARYRKGRQSFITNMSLSPEIGRKWLTEAMRHFADELEAISEKGFIEDWEAMKHRIEDIEAIFNPVKEAR